ncbi:MAG TPA: class I lanthipeptide [Chitinophaga sp.]|uniref:class I lanthipeptide n=1 Tax=Chitinophaga sp. TaxID=1869181 RepID=UPI002BC748FF|nr:class I lanthipeptide [Chitinophaga sp.]HVI44238.1 class I lanthipeptide [Chitinophaga sp.]
MIKKSVPQKLVLNKKPIASLSNEQPGVIRRKMTDPLTENPCDPVSSFFFCTRKFC